MKRQTRWINRTRRETRSHDVSAAFSFELNEKQHLIDQRSGRNPGSTPPWETLRTASGHQPSPEIFTIWDTFNLTDRVPDRTGAQAAAGPGNTTKDPPGFNTPQSTGDRTEFWDINPNQNQLKQSVTLCYLYLHWPVFLWRLTVINLRWSIDSMFSPWSSPPDSLKWRQIKINQL